jgi:DNA-binding CsgD family transcriptional regulator
LCADTAVPSMAAVSHNDPMVGRSAEFAELRAVLERAERGSGGVVVIEGEAGIGKSHLLSVLLEAARHLNFGLNLGRALELERERPFAPIIDSLGLGAGASDPKRAELADVLAAGGSVSSVDAHLGIERIADFVESLASRRATVLAIEDLHWADVQSLRALHRIAARVGDLPLMIVCTTRPVRMPELQSLLTALSSAGSVTVRLEPLDASEVNELVSASLGAIPGPRLLAKAAGASGNPLFVAELLVALRQDSLITTDAGVAEVADDALPPSLGLTVLRRLTFLSERTLESLRIASALGSSFSLRDLATVMERKPLELLASLDEAKGAGLLGEEDGKLRFRHDLVRDAIYEDMLLPIRKAIHAQIADALTRAGAPLGQIAAHVVLGAEVGDADSIDVLHAAAKEAMNQAPAVAAELLDKALALCVTTERRDEIALAGLHAQIAAGRLTDGERGARELAARSTEPVTRAEAQRVLGWSLTEQGRWQEAVQAMEADAHDESLPSAARARLLGELALAYQNYDSITARTVAEAAIELSQVSGDPDAAFLATSSLTLLDTIGGFVHEAQERATKFLSSEAMHHVVQRSSDFASRRCFSFLYGDEFDVVRAHLDSVRDQAGTPTATGVDYHFQLSHLLAWEGRWDEAVVEAEAGIAVSVEASFGTSEALIRQVLAYMAIHRDELDVAAAHIARDPSLRWVRALFAEATGDRAALAEVIAVYREMAREDRPWYYPQMWWVGPDQVRFFLAAGDVESASLIAAVLDEGARRSNVASARGAALRVRGMIDGDVDVMLQAVEAYRASPRVIDRALALENAATVMAPNTPTDAIALLEEAMAIFEPAGAARDLARCESHLRRLGVRRGRRGPRKRPKAGWDSLTETEQRVSGLVEEGLSYREVGERLFISRRTVETHVAHIFGKLGVSSRRDLADMVRQRSA